MTPIKTKKTKELGSVGFNDKRSHAIGFIAAVKGKWAYFFEKSNNTFIFVHKYEATASSWLA